MQKIVSTADVREPEAFDHWQDVTHGNISKNETLPFDGPRWSCELQAEGLADLSSAWSRGGHHRRSHAAAAWMIC